MGNAVKVERKGSYQGVPQWGITGSAEIMPTKATAEKWARLENAALSRNAISRTKQAKMRKAGESQIVHENGIFWIRSGDGQYTVYRQELTHSTADSSYAHDADGLSVAVARCNYLAKRGAL